MRWIRDDSALVLLDRSGEPFNHSDYRRAWTEETTWRDVSFGARAEDGTQAAIAVLCSRRTAHSLPLGYGGVIATRALDRLETTSFLRGARRIARADDLRAVSVPIDPSHDHLHIGGRVIAWTSVLYLDQDAPADSRLTKKGRQAIARAERAGSAARPASDNLESFLRLYEGASQDWSTQYPTEVLRRLAEEGLLRIYYVELDSAVEASAVALVGEHHWMYWLATQSDAGRAAELGYVALAALVADAHASGARAVNLGASAGLPGVGLFKRRFGGVDVPVLEYRSMRYLPVLARRAAVGARESLVHPARLRRS
jgi:hypothetical protein